MKEADLKRLHRPPPRSHALRGWTAASTGRPHPYTSPPLPSGLRTSSRRNSGQQRSPPQQGIGRRGRGPAKGDAVLSTRSETSRDLEALRTRRAVWRQARASRRQPPSCERPRLFPGRGRKLQSPSPAADTRGPPARREPVCRPGPRDRVSPNPHTF